MALDATSVAVYAAANMPENDDDTVGGAIDTTNRLMDDKFSGAARPEIVSDNAGDLMNCTITGRSVSGAFTQETKALNGTTPVLFDTTFARVLRIELASAATGDVTVKEGTGGTTRHTLNAGETGAFTLFTNAEADVTGGSDQTRYMKVFIKNVDADEDALNLTVALTTDPRSDYAIILEDAVDDNNSAADRTTEPTGNAGVWSDGPHAVVGTDLAFGTSIGLWIRQVLDDGTAAGFDAPVITVTYQDVE